MKLISRFPVKLAAIFLVLIAIAGAACILIALNLFERRQVEIDQRLNLSVADSMAQEIEPYLTEPDEAGNVGSVMHFMMVMNPYVEIYLLDGEGSILDYFATPGPPVELDAVDTGPIEAFLNGTRQLPILGDNPRRPDEHHHFSAARIDLGGGESGYLYVILRSSEYDQAAMGLQRDYLLRALQTAMLITIVFVGVVGLIVFFVATRPLERLSQTVRAFGNGDYRIRSQLRSTDEIGDLAASFNAMADEIVGNVERLARADKERRELIANISHDLRNPLATIQGYLETLSEKDESITAEDRRRYYDILLSTAKVLPRLVEDLFELSKLEDPEIRPAMEQFSLSELVQDVVMQWESRAEDASVTLVLDEPSSLHMVQGNVGLVERLLTNLVRNAVAYTPSGGTISVSLDEDGEAIRVSVADTGPGLSKEDQKRVFDRFYIGDASRTRSREGSGLGLAICKRIVELHDGQIGVTGTPGTGSTFWFRIPRQTTPAAGHEVI